MNGYSMKVEGEMKSRGKKYVVRNAAGEVVGERNSKRAYQAALVVRNIHSDLLSKAEANLAVSENYAAYYAKVAAAGSADAAVQVADAAGELRHSDSVADAWDVKMVREHFENGSYQKWKEFEESSGEIYRAQVAKYQAGDFSDHPIVEVVRSFHGSAALALAAGASLSAGEEMVGVVHLS